MNLRRLPSLAVLATLCLAGMLSACHPLPDTIKIGVAQPLSGPLKDLGQDMLDGTKMAVEELNKEGFKIDGKTIKLEVVAADDKADAEAGKQAAKTLIDAGVVAVIGHLNSGVSMAAAPLYAEKMIPQLAISTKPEYTKMGLPTTFRLVASDALQSKAMGSFAAQLPGQHVYAVVDDATPYGKGLAELALGQLKTRNKTVGLTMSLDDKTTEFAKLVAGIKDNKVDVLVTTLADFQTIALADQLLAAGLHNISIVGGDTIKTEGLLKINPEIGNIYATSPIVAAGEFLGGKIFLNNFRTEFKHDPVYAAHYAYDAVHVLMSAIRKSHSVDGKTLVETLKTLDPLAPVTSSMRFGADGEQRYGAVSVYQLTRGNWFLLTRSDVW
ncbi:branched-chain amino acid ABC transporter substrate-binding protein [Ideonella azotifigens]|uniref:Branched-chain amino acid ABC transporter substrate-binding protein n=1 Tax=Ideonella azotifigens TaxID=513160 RepID=A0ABN1K7J2_9BURK|nr:branched-chain amino acid ABC transporter substrate-binding protein [Ideonella azotifigens]MCD2342291.1 branched-chain amino acid ABC transporter substrate-binding protein [Ideonella azotifigens]